MARIVLQDVRKRYGSVEAIKGVSLDIADGELVVLVGPSGCGKSTLLRMIAGLESITGGQISIGDRVVNDLEPSERDIAMVFQNYALYPHMTVRQNLAYGLKNRNMPGPEIEARIAKTANALEIEPFLDRKPRQLSGGQLFDEPLSNLDAKLRVQMRVEIKRLQRSLKTTSIYVTHDQMEAMTLADRLVVLNGGLIEQVGTPIDLYENPATTFVATFIGSPSMNLLSPNGDRRWRLTPEGALPNGAVTLGIRPEDIAPVGASGSAEEGFHADVKVAAVELVGAESYVHGVFPDGEQLLFRVPGRSRIEIDDSVSVFARRDSFHFFDRDGRKVA